MGALYRLDIGEYIRAYGVDTFLETGTASGDSLAHALTFPFEKLFSIEIDAEQYRQTLPRFTQEQRATLVHASSIKGMQQILPGIEGRILFWLDAHFPGEWRGVARDTEDDMGIRLPLEQELSIIRELRGGAPDVLLIDDLRIYEDGPFTNGNWADRRTQGGDGIGFVHQLFDASHHITRIHLDEGYITLTPRT